jgi:hypothetical protein
MIRLVAAREGFAGTIQSAAGWNDPGHGQLRSHHPTVLIFALFSPVRLFCG